MENPAAAQALDAVAASVTVLSRLCQPLPGLAPVAAGGDPLRELADDCLDALEEVARLEARTAALKVRLAAAFVEAEQAMASPAASAQLQDAREMGLVAEVACVLTVSERAAASFLEDTRQLTTALPLTLAALEAGTVSWQHARIMVDETTDLPRAPAAALEEHFLDPHAVNPARGCPVGDLVPSRFRAKARTWRERHHPVSIEHRHHTRVLDRRLEYTPDRDGMAWLSAYLPADTAAAIWDRATTAARSLQRQGRAGTRNLAQLRADTTAAWLLAGTAESIPSPTAQVLVTVPVLSLLGATEEPALLDGYGPIPPGMARRLLAEGAASFHRVLTDPHTGAPLGIGRTSYRIPAAMRHWLRLRDGKCRLQQPLPAHRSRPRPTLAARRHHHRHEPRPALPETPPPQAHHRLETHQPQPPSTTRLDRTLRPALPQRTTRHRTTLAPTPNHHPRTAPSRPGCPCPRHRPHCPCRPGCG